MKKQYRALMLDLDGTTIPNSRDGMPSQRVIKAIKKAQEKLSVCVVTGRFLYEAEPILDALTITTPVIIMGGSQIIDGSTREFIYEQPLEAEDVAKVLALTNEYKVLAKIHLKNKAINKSESYISEKVFSIFIKKLTEATADKLIDKISSIPTVTAHKILSWNHGEFCLNISHSIATKQHAIFEISERLNIATHEMIGIGEGPNDFPLLMACGFKVAMGNAVPELKAIADYVAPSV